jgi:O-methyltransferase
MPETIEAVDLHVKGDFNDTSLDEVMAFVGNPDRVIFKQGLVPHTFAGLESASISLAHIDLDIYQSIIDALDFVWPRLSVGGFVLFDDYGFPSCPGARRAVDEFFAGSECFPLCLPTGQALVFKGQSA